MKTLSLGAAVFLAVGALAGNVAFGQVRQCQPGVGCTVGSLTTTGAVCTTSGGSATAPAFVPKCSDPDTGGYSVSDGNFGISVDGVVRVTVSGTNTALQVVASSSGSYATQLSSGHVAQKVLQLNTQAGASGSIITGTLGGVGTVFDVSSAGIVTSSVGSGVNGFACATSGCRYDLGTGASDYFDSDGTNPRLGSGTLASASTASATLVLTGAAGACLKWTTVGSVCSDSGGQTLGGVTTLADSLVLSSFTDDSATAGARTVNKVRGKNAVAAGASTVVITNSFVAAANQVLVTLEETDTTCLYVRAVAPAAGSFTLTVSANCTADTTFSWVVIK